MENSKAQLLQGGNSASTSNFLPQSYAFCRVINRFMASGDVSLSKLPGPTRTKIIEENIDTVRNVVEEKPNSSSFLPTPSSNSFPELVYTGKIRC